MAAVGCHHAGYWWRCTGQWILLSLIGLNKSNCHFLPSLNRDSHRLPLLEPTFCSSQRAASHTGIYDWWVCVVRRERYFLVDILEGTTPAAQLPSVLRIFTVYSFHLSTNTDVKGSDICPSSIMTFLSSCSQSPGYLLGERTIEPVCTRIHRSWPRLYQIVAFIVFCTTLY